MYGSTGLPGAYQSIGFAGVSDAVYATGHRHSRLPTSYGFRGGFTHNWDPYWNTGVYGAYAAVQVQRTAKGSHLRRDGIATAPDGGSPSCNPDFNIAQVGLITRWTPVKNLTFSADVTYTHLDQKYSGAIAAPADCGGCQAGSCV